MSHEPEMRHSSPDVAGPCKGREVVESRGAETLTDRSSQGPRQDAPLATVSLCDAFALRGGEVFQFAVGVRVEETPLAMMLATAGPLPEPSNAVCAPYALIGAIYTGGRWQWMQFAPDTKEILARAAEGAGMPLNTWLALHVGTKPVARAAASPTS